MTSSAEAPAAVRFPDWACRMADILNGHVTAGHTGRIVAIRLSDGGSDGVLYDNRRDAIRHQLHETLCDYIPLKPVSYSPFECFWRLSETRARYDAGWRWDIDGPAPITSSRVEASLSQLRRLTAARKR